MCHSYNSGATPRKSTRSLSMMAGGGRSGERRDGPQLQHARLALFFVPWSLAPDKLEGPMEFSRLWKETKTDILMHSTPGLLWAGATFPLGQLRERLKNPVFPLGPCSDSQRPQKRLMAHPWSSSIINNQTSWLGLSTGLSLVSSKDTCRADRESQSGMWHIQITIFLGGKNVYILSLIMRKH